MRTLSTMVCLVVGHPNARLWRLETFMAHDTAPPHRDWVLVCPRCGQEFPQGKRSRLPRATARRRDRVNRWRHSRWR